MNSDGIDRTIISWRAFYSDDREYDSLSCDWAELPELGVLCVVLYYRTRPYRRTYSGRSLYWREVTPRGVIYAHDDSADAIISDDARRNNQVKRGLWVTDMEMNEVRLKADASVSAPNEHERVDRVRG